MTPPPYIDPKFKKIDQTAQEAFLSHKKPMILVANEIVLLFLIFVGYQNTSIKSHCHGFNGCAVLLVDQCTHKCIRFPLHMTICKIHLEFTNMSVIPFKWPFAQCFVLANFHYLSVTLPRNIYILQRFQKNDWSSLPCNMTIFHLVIPKRAHRSTLTTK